MPRGLPLSIRCCGTLAGGRSHRSAVRPAWSQVRPSQLAHLRAHMHISVPPCHHPSPPHLSTRVIHFPPEPRCSRPHADGPLLGNGDMGAALGGIANGGASFYLGKMDFWTQSNGPGGKTDSRHLPTHVAPAHVTLTWGAAGESKAASFSAAQDLARAMVNATVRYASASLSASAVIYAEPGQPSTLFAELSFDQDVDVNVTLAASNLWDLPIDVGIQNQQTLVMQRKSNAWLNNAALLTECDADMLLQTGSRGVDVDAVSGRVTFVNASAPTARTCPAVESHPVYGPATIVAVACGSHDGPTDWRLSPADGTIRNANGSLCVAYPETVASPLVLTAHPCSQIPAGSASTWQLITAAAPLPEGGVHMLQALRLDNASSCCGSGSGCACNRAKGCSAGKGCCDWVDAGGCFTVAPPMLDYNLSIAASLMDADGVSGRLSPGAPSSGPLAVSDLARTLTFRFIANRSRYLRVTMLSSRDHEDANAAVGGWPAAANLTALAAQHTAFWESWWNASSVDLGPSRQVLESFYYGAQYMLACFARPGGMTAGLLGPWSLQDPVGWSDHLTLDVRSSGAFPARRTPDCTPCTLARVLPTSRRTPSGRLALMRGVAAIRAPALPPCSTTWKPTTGALRRRTT